MAKMSRSEARRLAALSCDCSFLLTHLIRQDSTSAPGETGARNRLLSILGINPRATPCLKATRVGWYSICSDTNKFFPQSGTFSKSQVEPSVCFTESTLAGLRAHREVFGARYGLSFDRDWMFAKGANPCLNIRGELLKQGVQFAGEPFPRKVFNYIPHHLHPFVNIINEAFDATHEREWRYIGDLIFAIQDLFFVFAPEPDFPLFSPIQRSGRPVLFDLTWLDRV